MINNGTKVRKRTNLSRHFYTNGEEDDEAVAHRMQSQQSRKPYNPTCHYWLLGFLAVIIVIVIMVTIFRAPPLPKKSKLSGVLNAYFSGTTLYEINFDAPAQFVQHAMDKSSTDLQQSIDMFYGEQHTKIIANTGWRIVADKATQRSSISKAGLYCEEVGCLFTIQLLDVARKMEGKKWLHLAVSYMISDMEDNMGIVKLWVDTKPDVDTNELDSEGTMDARTNVLVFDGFEKDTKAVTKVENRRAFYNDEALTSSEQLYLHVLLVEDASRSTSKRLEHKFKILGLALFCK